MAFAPALQGEAGYVGVAGQDGLVLCQILRSGGRAVFGQIGGRGHQMEIDFGQGAGNQVFRRLLGEAQCHVFAVAVEVDAVVGEREV